MATGSQRIIIRTPRSAPQAPRLLTCTVSSALPARWWPPRRSFACSVFNANRWRLAHARKLRGARSDGGNLHHARHSEQREAARPLASRGACDKGSITGACWPVEHVCSLSGLPQRPGIPGPNEAAQALLKHRPPFSESLQGARVSFVPALRVPFIDTAHEPGQRARATPTLCSRAPARHSQERPTASIFVCSGTLSAI